MSHPAMLLKRYLTELNERIVKLDAKSDGCLQTVSETISKLDEKVDNCVQTTNQAIGDLYREKLSVQEFREFVNTFNRILGESFPLPGEPVPQTPEPTLIESRAEDDSRFQGEVVVGSPTESDAPQSSEAASSTQVVQEVIPEPGVDSPSSEVGEQASLPQAIEETALPPEATVGEVVRKHVGFPMRVVGESFYVGDGVTSIVGDVEIPPGTTVDETLVVKGNFRSCESCRLLNNVKALKNIEIGEGTTVEGALLSGGRVTVNSNCVVNGSIESDGDIEIGENVVVKKNLSSKLSIILSKSAQVFGAINAAKGVLRP